MFDEVSTDEEEDPYHDSDDKYGSDRNYVPNCCSELEEGFQSSNLSEKHKEGDNLNGVWWEWRDKRDVLVITIRNHSRTISVNNRFGKEKNNPEEVATYNDHMSGIDRCDQMTATYATSHKTIRWYKKSHVVYAGRDYIECVLPA
ncbi:hypothetical protein ILUMI_07943 [Ignelater luminosus]|uniref:PiggyBac transposable element-derived protein domain-containing protein n=1 Tax=Ignelater luminosus TaxID=2038154 RepID=A0A8K0D729_IGNLU|nr:hypothetical protein ILUMI_07943 [Ignelater luminosus]